MSTPIRVLIVDDSRTVRAAFRDVLSADPGFVVVGEAADGEAAIEACREARPDVITLDMAMPGLTGLDVTRWVMRHMPMPILVVSSSHNRGDALRTLDALSAGAVDVLDKTDALTRDARDRPLLVRRLRTVARIPVMRHLRPKGSRSEAAPTKTPAVKSAPAKAPEALAIGASTGGPRALVEVLQGLAAPLSVPVLVVLHIGEGFAPTLAPWLESTTKHPVGYANSPIALAKARGVWLAPPGQHLIVERGLVQASDAPPRHGLRPSVDVLFESVARALGPKAVGVLLTGMGRDGAEGLRIMRAAGATTIAQDEASSVVWGMPGAAVALGAATKVLPLASIGGALSRALSRALIHADEGDV